MVLSFVYNTTFRKLDSVSVFRWSLFSWAQQILYSVLVPLLEGLYNLVRSSILPKIHLFQPNTFLTTWILNMEITVTVSEATK
jgi:hypothetical protein